MVKLEEFFPSDRPPKVGVPQGGQMSPKIFNIFTSDIPKPGNHNVKTSQFADKYQFQAT